MGVTFPLIFKIADTIKQNTTINNQMWNNPELGVQNGLIYRVNRCMINRSDIYSKLYDRYFQFFIAIRVEGQDNFGLAIIQSKNLQLSVFIVLLPYL